MAMKSEREFYCVATTTLEVGIDIGYIDAGCGRKATLSSLL